MTEILVAHAPDAEARASAVAEKLSAFGFQVRRQARAPGLAERRRLVAAVDSAPRVLVLPSGDPVLRAAARRARAAGKLVRWTPGADGRAWRSLAASVGAMTQAPARKAQAPAPKRDVNKSVLLIGFVGLFAALCAGAYYLLP